MVSQKQRPVIAAGGTTRPMTVFTLNCHRQGWSTLRTPSFIQHRSISTCFIGGEADAQNWLHDLCAQRTRSTFEQGVAPPVDPSLK